MSDTTVTTEAPRSAPSTLSPSRESSGQFRSSEPAYGREGLERAAGFRPLKEKREDDAIDGQDRTAMRDAASELARARQEKPIEVHESGLKPNVTLSIEQATKRIEESRDANVSQAELDSTKAQQKAVDELRGSKPETQARQAHVETEPDIETVLKHPKVSAALAERVTAAETQRAAYESSVKEIGKVRIAALAADFPELANLPLDKWVSAITAMHQREPARAKLAYNRLQGLAQVEAAVQQIAQQKAAREQTEFKQYSAKENARFAELTKGIPPQQMAAITAEVPAMLAEVGVTDPRAFLKAIEGQSIFPRGSAERLLVDAARYRLMQKAAKPTPARPQLPPVQQPGHAQPRTNPQSANLKALNQRLSNTGDLKTAAALLAAMRKKGR
jgi:hypothetical protein